MSIYSVKHSVATMPQIIHHQDMKIIANNIQICDENTRQKCLLVMISQASERAVIYTGKSRSVILRIQRKHRYRNATNPSMFFLGVQVIGWGCK